jgi:hypothetical protein
MSAGAGPASPLQVQRHLPGERVMLVHWVPGSDTLLGVCHCGAQHLAQSPIEVWEWLLGHPVGHDEALGAVLGSAGGAAEPVVVAG